MKKDPAAVALGPEAHGDAKSPRASCTSQEGRNSARQADVVGTSGCRSQSLDDPHAAFVTASSSPANVNTPPTEASTGA
jgi:hypothetical protein